MIAVAMLLGWIGYATGYWGYSLVKGYNIGLKQIVSPVNYYSGQWPPAQSGNSVIIPDGSSASLTNVAFTSTTTSDTSTSSGVGNAPAGISSSKAINMAASMFGWNSGQQWSCLTSLINAESGGNAQAKNPSSGAYGIAQALGHGTSGTAGSQSSEYGAQYGLSTAQAKQANSGNAYYQAIWMMGYIKATYGTPCNAWAHEQSNHWY